MTCGHTFHDCCMQTYITTTGETISTIKCPVCKLTSADISLREQSLGLQFDFVGAPEFHPEAASSGGDGGIADGGNVSDDEPLVIEDGDDNDSDAALVPAPAASAPAAAAVAEAAAFVNGEAKAKAKAKPKAKAKADAKAKAKGAVKGKGKAKGIDHEAGGDGTGVDGAGAGQGNAVALGQGKGQGKGKGKGKGSENGPPLALPSVGNGSAGAGGEGGNGDADAGDGEPPLALQSEGDDDGDDPARNHVVSMFDGHVMCDSCDRYSHFTKCRVISKRVGTWRCGSCGVKSAQLRRLFGSWPTGQFSLLSKERIACHPIHHQW